MNFKVNFHNMDWEYTAPGIKQKIIEKGEKRLRLIRFEDNFIEKDWCTENHIGYITKGEMKIDFESIIIDYKKGDGLLIENGTKHKALIEKSKFVEIILFE